MGRAAEVTYDALMRGLALFLVWLDLGVAQQAKVVILHLLEGVLLNFNYVLQACQDGN